MSPAQALSDPVAEGRRVGKAAAAAHVPLKLTGGVAVAVTSPSARHPPLARAYADVDFVGRGGTQQNVTDLLAGLGYVADEHFNAVQGDRRLLFFDRSGRQLDVFVDRFELCHELDLSQRLDGPAPTLALADLLLMKLQVIETNEKDYLDIVALLADHAFTDDADGIELPYVLGVLSADWGWWRTTTMVAERAAAFADGLEGFDDAATVRSRVDELLAAAEAAPKSRRWKLRARIGERKRWYELPEESH